MNVKLHPFFPEVKIIYNFVSTDDRGRFVKIYNEKEFLEWGLNVSETYYSISNVNTIRGMHFQIPPYEHNKLVHVISGKVVDVLVDLRRSSSNYKMAASFILSGENPQALFIPKGFAHGFKCIEDNTIMLYCCSSIYNAEYDKGIKYNSIPYNWEIENPIISRRDLSFPKLKDFDSPFE